jgi:hypothetical protein
MATTYNIALAAPFILINPSTGANGFNLDSSTARGIVQQTYFGSPTTLGVAVVYKAATATTFIAIDGSTSFNMYIIDEALILFSFI